MTRRSCTSARPNASHVPYAVALMEAGKHVLCEKPLGIGLTDAQHAYEVARADRRGQHDAVRPTASIPMAREMQARVQGDEFGAVNLIHGSYLQDWLLDPRATSWRVDPKAGGPSRAFGDIGSHWCDLAEWVTGDRIAELVATHIDHHQAAAGRDCGDLQRGHGPMPRWSTYRPRTAR